MTLYSAIVANGAKCPEDGVVLLDDSELADFRAWNQRRQLRMQGS